jgi:DNA-binding response OmpR family regulator
LNWLIAEDETDIRNLVKMMITVWGHNPLVFENGQRVWDYLDRVEGGEMAEPVPEFVLMDIRMPGKRGNELALRMRSIDAFKRVPIVLMTAFALSEDEMAQMQQDYAVDYIINKPLPDFDQLRILLHNIIQQKAQAS